MFNHLRRKAILATSCLAMAAATTACGAVGDDTSKTKSSGVSIDVGSGKITPSEAKRVALILNNDLSATYSVALVDAAKALAKKSGVALDIKYDKLDATTELSNYQSVVSSKKYQGVIIQPLTGQLCDAVKKDAVDNDLAVVVIVSPLCSDSPDEKTAPWYPGTLSFVGGMNNRAHTVELMESAAKNTPGPQKILRVVGTQTLPDTVSFLGGFDEYAKTNADWKVANTVYTDFTTPDAFAKTQNALQGNKDVTMIVTSYAGITDGVAQALEAAGLTDKVAVYDQTGGNAQSVKLIKAGKLTGTLPSYPASIGEAALQAIIDAGKGKTPERFIDNDGNPDAAKGAITKADLATLTPQYD
jgi:ribose transport system substrate-binding protein